MRLLRCKQCGEYSKSAYAKVQVHISVELGKDGLWYADDEVDLYGYGLDVDETFLKCHQCEGDMEIVTLEQCPHEWRVRLDDGTQRECRICGQEQKGTVIWK